MYRSTPARLGGRTRRALLAAALSTAAAASALPAAAEAGTASVVDAGGGLVAGYAAADGETNNVRVTVADNKLVFADSAPVAARNGCTLNAQGDAECPIGVDSVIVLLRDRNDTVQYRAPHRASVSGEQGQDVFFGALRQAAPGRPIQPVFYFGNADRDTINYALADRGVRVDTEDLPSAGPPEDGRPGIDLESVGDDFETIEGSNFDDTLFGSDADDLLRGHNGADVIAGRDGADTIDEGSVPNGRDTFSGGDGANDRIFYSLRTSGVDVSLDGTRNDGAAGEQDNVSGSFEHIGGTNSRDVLTGNGQANTIDGFGGPDTINGLGGNDTLSAGAGNNGITAGTGNDVVFARNGQIDDVDCGDNTDTDTLDRDPSENRIDGCERVTVGVLRLTPKAVSGRAGEVAQLRLSWRHPQSWRKLRKIELRLLSHDGLEVGEVTIRPRAGRASADGAVELVRRATRLTKEGKTVTARLALRLDESLAGQTLKAEVEATDRRGRRQLERDAGTVRVAG
jgi:Ca2+-binding RTX toxin-like protein